MAPQQKLLAASISPRAKPLAFRLPPSLPDPGCAKIRAFNSLVESSSQFGQSETQKCWRRLSDEGNRENRSTLSWLAHVFTRPGPKAAVRCGDIGRTCAGFRNFGEKAMSRLRDLRWKTSLARPYAFQLAFERLGAPSAMIFCGLDLIRPASCSCKTQNRIAFSGSCGFFA